MTDNIATQAAAQDKSRQIKFKTVAESADILKGLVSSNGSVNIVQAEVRKSRRNKSSDVAIPLAGTVPVNTKETVDERIKIASDVAEQSKIRANQLLAQNIAETSVANDIASQTAPTTLAIKELGDRIEAMEKNRPVQVNTELRTVDEADEADNVDEADVSDIQQIANSLQAVRSEWFNNPDVYPDPDNHWANLNGAIGAATNPDTNPGERQIALRYIESKLGDLKTWIEDNGVTVDDPVLITGLSLDEDPDDDDDFDEEESNKQHNIAKKRLTLLESSAANGKSPDVIYKNKAGNLLLNGKTISVGFERLGRTNWLNVAEEGNGEYTGSVSLKTVDQGITVTPGVQFILTNSFDEVSFNDALKSGAISSLNGDIELSLRFLASTLGSRAKSPKLEWLKKEMAIEIAQKEAAEAKGKTPKKVKVKKDPVGEGIKSPGRTIQYTYEIDPLHKKVKVYQLKADGSRSRSPLTIYNLTDDLHILLTQKKISRNRRFDPVALTAFKDLVSYVPSIEKLSGNRSYRYSIIHGTKKPDSKSIIHDKSNNPDYIAESLEINIGLRQAGNTSDDLFVTILNQIEKLKKLRVIDAAEAKHLASTL